MYFSRRKEKQALVASMKRLEAYQQVTSQYFALLVEVKRVATTDADRAARDRPLPEAVRAALVEWENAVTAMAAYGSPEVAQRVREVDGSVKEIITDTRAGGCTEEEWKSVCATSFALMEDHQQKSLEEIRKDSEIPS